MNKDVKYILLEMMEDYIDEELIKGKFTRKQKSLFYTKKIGNVKQKIIMRTESYYSTNVFVYPFFSVSFPEIMSVAKKMTENDSIFSRIITKSTKDTINEPVQLISKTELWMLMEKKIGTLALQILDYFKQYVIPLLADLECIDDYIKLYENNDKRIVWDDLQSIYIASAYIIKKEYVKALDVFESRFKALGHRQHITILHYIENLY